MAEFRMIQPQVGTAPPAARKTAAGENFPVASQLLAKRIRPHVLAFYNFVRLADDIADDPHLDPEIKLTHLDALERALVEGRAASDHLRVAVALRESCDAVGVSDSHARQMIQAFRRDAENAPCRTWGELLMYCRYSAVPVGRHLLALHGEGEAPVASSDALCTALQVLNHLQDCRADWCELGRCYIPLVWFDQAHISPERLVETASGPDLRTLFNRLLDQVDTLLIKAEPLPAQIRDRRLRLEAAVIVSLAKALARRLRRRDPLAGHVRLPWFSRLGAAMGGVLHGLSAP